MSGTTIMKKVFGKHKPGLEPNELIGLIYSLSLDNMLFVSNSHYVQSFTVMFST